MGGGGFRRGPPPGEEGATLELEALGTAIQSFLIGGGAGVPTVAMETSPIIFMASLQA